MSIVEKAVGRLGSGGPNRRPKKSAGAAGRSVLDKGAVGYSDKPIVDTSQVVEHGFLSVLDDPQLAREFRLLKRPLLARVFGLSQAAPKAGNLVLMASALPGAGKSSISFNLAVSIANEQMTNVLLIDGDAVKKTLSKMLGQESVPGLLDVLGDPSLDIDAVTLATDIPSLRFIPTGQYQENATELLSGRRMGEVLASLEDPDTVVLIDSPPLLVTSEARVLADKVHHTLIVVEAGGSTAAQIETILKILAKVESTISFVLNKSRTSENLPKRSEYYNY